MEGAIHRNSLMISDAFCTFDGMSTRTYDDKGNLRTDSGRGISRILYNWQDQPTEINFSDGHRISITYDGYGNKLQVDYMTAQPIVVGSMHINSYKLDSRTYYSHGRVFKQNVGNLSFLEMTSHPYGYFDGDGKPYYYLPDYQGNITMVTDNDGMVQSHSRYYPYGETITRFKASETTASPKTNFGQRYKYGGKEYETMYGLNAYDFGPRHLGADLAVWASPDRRQDSYHNLSPYAYCAGNPIRYADPTGEKWTDLDGNALEDVRRVKKFIFYSEEFSDQAEVQYKDGVRKYGEGNVAMSIASSIETFTNDWKNMGGDNISEVMIMTHGKNQSIILDNADQFTATGNGVTNLKNNEAPNIQDLPQPSGNIYGATLYLYSCHSADTNPNKHGEGEHMQGPLRGSKKPIAYVFAQYFLFYRVYGTSESVNYHSLGDLTFPWSNDYLHPYPADGGKWMIYYNTNNPIRKRQRR